MLDRCARLPSDPAPVMDSHVLLALYCSIYSFYLTGCVENILLFLVYPALLEPQILAELGRDNTALSILGSDVFVNARVSLHQLC